MTVIQLYIILKFISSATLVLNFFC